MYSKEINDRFERADSFAECNDLNNAFAEFTSLAEEGYGEALYMLGEYYLYGHHVEQNIEKAIEYFIRPEVAIEFHGYMQAARSYYTLGDREKCLNYFELAINSGDMLAMSYLGFSYAGLNPWYKSNMDKAMHYHMLAAQHGQVVSNLEYVKLKMHRTKGLVEKIILIPHYFRALYHYFVGSLFYSDSKQLCIQSQIIVERLNCSNRFI